MRLLCLVALALVPALATAQSSSQPTPVRDSRTQVAGVAPQDGTKELTESDWTKVFLLLVKQSEHDRDNVCLAMRVYTHDAHNPKTLTGYTECQKVRGRTLRNVELVPAH